MPDKTAASGVPAKMKFSLNILIVTIASVACSLQATAQSTLLITERDAVMPGRLIYDAVCRSNAAAMVYRDSVSRSSMGLSFLYDTQSRPVLAQNGDGYRDFMVRADSYTRLGDKSVVWGDASFTTGKMRNIRWADCIDYERLAPYVLGDPAGGDLSTREYDFSGGYATHLGRWSVGVFGSYRAEIASRNRDPRLRAIVSDLNIEIGLTRRVSDSYVVGAKAALEIYRQNCDLDFYNPLNDINTYPLTGLGTYYNRFSGNSNEAAGYQADGGRVGVQLLSRELKGFNCYLVYGRERVQQRLRDYNNLTLAYLTHSSLGALVSYRFQINKSLRVAPVVSMDYDDRRGTENLFGTAIGSGYEVIGERDNYRLTRYRLSVGVPVEFTHGNSCLSVAPALTGTGVECKVIDVDRRVCVRGLAPGLSAGYSGLMSGSVLLKAGLSADYSMNRAPESRNNLLTQLSAIDDKDLAASVAGNYEMLKADCLRLGAEIGVGKMISQVLYSININYRYRRYESPADCHRLDVTLSATF